MAIDLNKMRAKLSAMKNKSGGDDSTTNWWKPTLGEQVIRIVSTPDGDPFKGHWLHYGVGNSSGFLCPKKNFSDDCPVCNFVGSLWKEANKGDEESKTLAKKMGAKQRFFSPVLVRGEEKEGIRVWAYGKNAYAALLQLVLNPDYGDITDPDGGTDLNLRYSKPDGVQFPQTDLMPARKVSKLCPDSSPEECKELLSAMPDLDTLHPRQSTADVQKKLDESFSDDESAEDRSSESVKYSEAAKPKATSSVEEAFADLTQ